MKKTGLISALTACSALSVSAQAPAQIVSMRAVSPQHAVQVPLRSDAHVLISAAGVSATVTVHYDGNASITSAIADSDDAPAQLFNIAGQQVSDVPAPGIYFQRTHRGEVTKKLVK